MPPSAHPALIHHPSLSNPPRRRGDASPSRKGVAAGIGILFVIVSRWRNRMRGTKEKKESQTANGHLTGHPRARGDGRSSRWTLPPPPSISIIARNRKFRGNMILARAERRGSLNTITTREISIRPLPSPSLSLSPSVKREIDDVFIVAINQLMHFRYSSRGTWQLRIRIGGTMSVTIITRDSSLANNAGLVGNNNRVITQIRRR